MLVITESIRKPPPSSGATSGGGWLYTSTKSRLGSRILFTKSGGFGFSLSKVSCSRTIRHHTRCLAPQTEGLPGNER